MGRKLLLLLIFLTLVIAIALSFQHLTLAQGPSQGTRSGGQQGQAGPPSGMIMMQILPLEMEWAYISFNMNVSDNVLTKARKVFLDTWTKRKAILDKSDPTGDDENTRRAMRDSLTKLKTELDTKLKAILTPKQMEELAKWEKENQQRFRNRPNGTPSGQSNRTR